MRKIRVAVIGAGPAGIYASDILTGEYADARVDLFDRLPAPYGLVRYGVAPDHPRIKEIIKALRRVLSRRACLVEIVDGYENYTSVLAVLDSSLLEAGTRLKGGERVEGIVTHNNIGVMLKKLKLVSAA